MAESSSSGPTRYPVITTFRDTRKNEKVNEMAFVLDHWDLFENGRKDPVLDTPLKNALCGSSSGGAGKSLTLLQLFSAWKNGHLIHPSYYGRRGVEVHEELCQVGIGCALSGSFVFWGIVPSRKTIVISDRTPHAGKCGVASNMVTYQKAANGEYLAGT